MEKLRAPISDDLKDSIKYMRRRVELKHRNLDLDIQEQENKRRLKIIEDEMAKDENGLKDFSKYMFDNCTGKVTDISKDFKLSAIWEEAKKSKFPNEMVCTKTTADLRLWTIPSVSKSSRRSCLSKRSLRLVDLRRASLMRSLMALILQATICL